MGQAIVLAGQRITPAVLNRIYGFADNTSHTVNGTSFATLSSIYTIAASDPAVGTAYRITAWGTGSYGTASASLSLAVGLAGTGGTAVSVASTAFSSGATVHWLATAVIVCSSTGSSGTYTTNLGGNVNQVANALLPATAADNTVPLSVSVASVTEDTTSSMTFQIMGKWSATTGSPSISCLGTLFERVN